MGLKEFIKYELSGWKRGEIFGLSFVFLFIFINAFIVKDSIVAVISAVCGILYTTVAGKGKISCYIFGLCGTFCYSWLSYDNALWGNLFLYIGYYFPMQVWGLFEWRIHLQDSTKEIIKSRLSVQERAKLAVTAVILIITAVFILKYFNDSNPLFDGITTILSVFGMYLTVKRCIEQWVVWMVVNGLSALMWLNLVLHGAKTYSTFIMWCVYFILAFYFYFCWRREMKSAKLPEIN